MYLLDTDIIIYSLKNSAQVTRNLKLNANAPKSISVVTYGELSFGAAKSTQKAKNLAIVKRTAELFPVVNLNMGIMDIFGELKSILQKKGTTVDDFDLLIASTALYRNYTLVTNNESHYKNIKGLKIVNWAKQIL